MRARARRPKAAPARPPVPPADEAAVAEAAAAALKAGKKRRRSRPRSMRSRLVQRCRIDDALADERAVFQRLRSRAKPQRCGISSSPSATAPSTRRSKAWRRAPCSGRRHRRRHDGLGHRDRGARCRPTTSCCSNRTAAALDRGTARIRDHYAAPRARRQDEGESRRSLRGAPAQQPGLDRARDGRPRDRGGVRGDRRSSGRSSSASTRVAKPGAVLASNTSYLDLDAIADATSRPQDVIGLHFFSPANVMRLMEVVRGRASAPDALATGLALGRKLKKLPLLTGNAFGFVGNRLYAAYRKQCEFMVEEGAWPEQVDAALERVRLRDGTVRGGRPVRPGHRLAHAAGAGRHARSVRTLRADSPTGFAKPAASAARPAPATTATATRASRRSIRRCTR